jgi:hypothetical protein
MILLRVAASTVSDIKRVYIRPGVRLGIGIEVPDDCPSIAAWLTKRMLARVRRRKR